MGDSYFELSAVNSTDKDCRSVVSIKLADDSTWMDICDSFTGYLQACGFIVSANDVIAYLHSVYGYTEEATR